MVLIIVLLGAVLLVALALLLVMSRRRKAADVRQVEDAGREVLKTVRDGDWLSERKQYGKAIAAYQAALRMGPHGPLLKQTVAKLKEARKTFGQQVESLRFSGSRLATRWTDECCSRLEPVGDPVLAQQVVEAAGDRGALKMPSAYEFDDIWRSLAERLGGMAMASPRWTPKAKGHASLDYAMHCIVDELATNARKDGKGEVIIAWNMSDGWLRMVDQREWFNYELRVLLELSSDPRQLMPKRGGKQIDRSGGGGMGLGLVKMLVEKFELSLEYRYLKQFKTGNEFVLRCPERSQAT